MKVNVLYFGQLRELTEVSQADVSVRDNASLADLIEHLVGLYGDVFRTELDSIQGLRILINGREYTLLGGMDTVLSEGDTVVFLPPISGG